MRKFVCVLVILLIFMPAIFIKSSAAGNRVIDEDGLLQGDTASLEYKLREAEEACCVPIRVYLYEPTYRYGFSYHDEDYLLSRFGMTTSDDVVMLVITLEGSVYYYELFTYGRGYDYISDTAADRILDDSGVRAIKRGDLAGGISAFADVSSYELQEGKVSHLFSSVFVSALLGLGAGGLTFGLIFANYKKKLKSPIYPLSNYARLHLTVCRDDFVNSYVTRVRINNSSGSGGGRSGGSRGGSRGRR